MATVGTREMTVEPFGYRCASELTTATPVHAAPTTSVVAMPTAVHAVAAANLSTSSVGVPIMPEWLTTTTGILKR